MRYVLMSTQSCYLTKIIVSLIRTYPFVATSNKQITTYTLKKDESY